MHTFVSIRIINSTRYTADTDWSLAQRLYERRLHVYRYRAVDE